MPSLPSLDNLPFASLVRLRALNPGLMDELQPAVTPPVTTVADMVALEAEMRVIADESLVSLLALAKKQATPAPTPTVVVDKGCVVFRYVGATIAVIYIFLKAGALG